MTAFKIGLIALMILAAGALGCSKEKTADARPQPSPAGAVSAKGHVFALQPTAAVISSAEGGRLELAITVPDASGSAVTFHGAIGVYDQGVFESAQAPSDSLQVVSLDKSAETLVTIHRSSRDTDAPGTAYVFKRTDAAAPFRLAWRAGGLTALRAVDLDTYMQEKDVSVTEAIVQLQEQGRWPGLASRSPGSAPRGK